MTIKKPNKIIERITNALHIYSAKTYKDGSIVYCDYIKRVYYVTGELKSECPYFNGKEHGISKGYYKNGKLQFEIPYSFGIKHGIKKWHYKTGELMYDVTFIMGKAHGACKEYYKNGELRAELSCKNGEIYDIKFHKR